MIIAELLPKLPIVKKWIDDVLEKHEFNAKPVSTLGFARLPGYFSDELLKTAKYIPSQTIPVFPVSTLGISGLSLHKKGEYAGITYNDRFFINLGKLRVELVHFHELIHVLQWRYLGVDKFIVAYALEIVNGGSQNNRFEQMAYRHQDQFNKTTKPYDVEREIKKELDMLVPMILTSEILKSIGSLKS